MITLKGIEEHPRYMNSSNPISKFNHYLSSPFFRYVIMAAIQGCYNQYREPINIIENALEEAYNVEDPLPTEEVEVESFKQVLLSFLESEKGAETYRGPLFEQVIRAMGPSDIDYPYKPEYHSLEDAKIFCDSGYENGNTNKNVDIVFFNGTKIAKNHYETTEFIACEIKCSINSFIESIIRSRTKSNDLNENRNYQKMIYLKEMLDYFGDSGKVIIYTLREPREGIKRFLAEIGLHMIPIYNTIL